MIAKCPNCAVLLECEQQSGELVDCANCGNTFELPRVSAAPNAFAKPVSSPPSSSYVIKQDRTMTNDELGRKLMRNTRLMSAGLMMAAIMMGVALYAIYMTINVARHGSTDWAEVRAEKLTVVDGDGKPCVVLSAHSGGAMLTMTDGGGKPRLTITTLKEGPELCMLDEAGMVRVSMDVGDSGAALGMRDKGGQDRILLGVDRDMASMMLNDDNNKPRVMLSAANGRLAGLGLHDVTGKVRAKLGVGIESTALTMLDDNGNERIVISTDKLGILGVLDEYGNVIWSAP